MIPFASALARSTLAHLALAGAVVAWLGVRGGWLHQELRFGAAHPSGNVELHWSRGASQAARTPKKKPAVASVQSHEDDHAGGPSADLGSGPESRPEGSIIVPRGAPEYPALSRRAGEQGTVTLEFLLRDGKAEQISVLRSSGHARLDESALDFLQSTHLDSPREAALDRKLQVSFVFQLR